MANPPSFGRTPIIIVEKIGEQYEVATWARPHGVWQQIDDGKDQRFSVAAQAYGLAVMQSQATTFPVACSHEVIADLYPALRRK